MTHYTQYWGKASPREDGSRYHLLCFHSLDVAACGHFLLEIPRFGLGRISAELGWSPDRLQKIFTAFLAAHDIGKFARAFQGLAPDLGLPLVQPNPKFAYTERHDTLGFLFLRDSLPDPWRGMRKDERVPDFWKHLFRIVSGHHGIPPRETHAGQPLRMAKFFHEEDVSAAQAFLTEALGLLLDGELPPVSRSQAKTIQRLSWQLAGIAVLADWLGSNANHFPYHEQPDPLSEYWAEVAQPQAQEAIHAAGLAEPGTRAWSGAQTLFDFPAFTPLQEYAATVEFAAGPQLFLLEDVTGAGKTEAALLLCHRLMAAGRASGFYFGLPTMATANQLYTRVGAVYRKLYDGGSPSLVLSHSARDLVTGFRESVLAPAASPAERDYQAGNRGEEEWSATTQCSAWLADSRKKAMLADVGVGTVDQALLGVLPVRHQSLRLLGLANKVLIIDEVHAYDAYTTKLLETLVQAHTMAGGSTVLLSATVPAVLREKLVRAFQQGFPSPQQEEEFAPQIPPLAADSRYPLATHLAQDREPCAYACATRPDLVREVRVESCPSFEAGVAFVAERARAGSAVCWVRNTVEDARDAYRALSQQLAPAQPLLFHSRFHLEDRLRIEQIVLNRFGKESSSEGRRGQVLIATQVVEQSLDLDFDELLTDLAPIDLLIQRAGRLHRHVRARSGSPVPKSSPEHDGREAPVLHILSPPHTAEPTADWYKRLLPRASYIYTDTGKLWLTLETLLGAGRIMSPGAPGEKGSVRQLMEAVYGDVEAPEAFQKASNEAQGKASSERSLGDLNAIKLERGYQEADHDWKSDTPTRLGEESRTVYLVREENGALLPFAHQDRFAWEMSAVSVPQRLLGELAPEWQARFSGRIAALCKNVRLLSNEHESVFPLVEEDGGWLARCARKGKPQLLRYSSQLGLETEGIREEIGPA